MVFNKTTFVLLAPLALMGCEMMEGTTAYRGPDSYIAIAADRGRDANNNDMDNAAIAVTPDGCQAWVIDDGLEGRASNRLDPVTGLPVCDGEPGVVYGPYQSGSAGIPDRVLPGPAQTSTEIVPVQSYSGYYRPVHPTTNAND